MISRRALEALTAAITGTFGVAVMVSSLDNGIGWGTGGVDSGTFPFITGAIIAAASLWNFVRGVLRGPEILVSRTDLARTLKLFVPAAIYVALIPLAGMYVTSAVYILAALKMQKMPLWKALAISIVVAVALYVVFEWFFQVELPHGLLGHALDL
jgi:hypothetical protein